MIHVTRAPDGDECGSCGKPAWWTIRLTFKGNEHHAWLTRLCDDCAHTLMLRLAERGSTPSS